MGLTNKILGVEYLNQNALRAYPIADDTTEADVTGSFTLPRDVLVDMIIPIDTGLNLDPGGFHISNISVFAQGITITFAHTDNSNTTTNIFGTLSVSLAGHILNASYFLSGQGIFAGMVGKVTIGSLSSVLSFGGTFDFDLGGGRLIPTVFRPDIRGVKSLQVINGSENSDLLYDAITLEAGSNMRITVQDVDSVQSIRFDALDSTDLSVTCGCATATQLPEPIRSINGVPPKPDGTFQFIAGTCVSIDPGGVSDASITIADTCSEPCCGTPELEVVQSALDQLNLDIHSMRNLQDLLENSLLEVGSIKSAIQNTGLMASDT